MDKPKARHPSEVREAIASGLASKAELARRAKVHRNSLNAIDDPAWSPSWSTLEALCRAADEIRTERA